LGCCTHATATPTPSNASPIGRRFFDIHPMRSGALSAIRVTLGDDDPIAEHPHQPAPDLAVAANDVGVLRCLDYGRMATFRTPSRRSPKIS
jgi:hypothetical protein